MNQTANINLIKRLFKPKFKQIRFIKIHGGKFQEAGLMDLMILTNSVNFWLEVKRNWKDQPTKIQEFNINDIKKYNFTTGVAAGDEIKLNLSDKPVKITDFLKKYE